VSDEAGRITPRFRPQQVEKNPPCQLSCPNCSDIRHWIGLVAQRDKIGLSAEEAFAQAWRTITDVNPFPAVMGRVCPHPCESGCNRSEAEEPLAINAMERFLGDWAISHRLPLGRLDGESPDESIGVIGAGPSGLSFAYQMARRGYQVTVYESRAQAGGMLRYGIPDYRLPQDVLDAEIQRILDLGVEVRLNTQIGRDVTVEELRSRHDVMYLGIGAQKGRALGIPGEEGPSVWTGTEYLDRLNRGETVPLGRHVVVVGGGNTAVDAARSARRNGANVTMLYRRSRAEMPAIAEEVDDALDEGVTLLLQAAPVRLDRQNGRLQSLVACRMDLGEADASGRRRPVAVPDSEFVMPADTVIAAVSQEPDTTGLETVTVAGSRLSPGEGGGLEVEVLAGGDVLSPGIAAQAIVAGRYAAEALHARLRGLPPPPKPQDLRRQTEPEEIHTEFHESSPAAHPARLPASERLQSQTAEVASTISEVEFLTEAGRCFSCGSCFGCQQCAMYCTSQCFTKLDKAERGFYYTLSLDQCEECGKCISVCPCGYLEVTPPE